MFSASLLTKQCTNLIRLFLYIVSGIRKYGIVLEPCITWFFLYIWLKWIVNLRLYCFISILHHLFSSYIIAVVKIILFQFICMFLKNYIMNYMQDFWTTLHMYHLVLIIKKLYFDKNNYCVCNKKISWCNQDSFGSLEVISCSQSRKVLK